MTPNVQIKKKKVGLAISGGWIRAISAIGVIQVLEENNVPIDLVSGCSAGGGVAAAYAAGSLEEFRNRFRKGSWKDYWRIIFEPTLPKEGLLRGRRTREFFKEFFGQKDFSDLDKKLFIAVTDLNSLSPVIIEDGNIVEAVQASVSIPGMFVPVKNEDKIFADGGNFNLIPSEILYQRGAEYVIATDLTQSPNIFNKTLGSIKKTFGYKQKSFEIGAGKNPNILRLIWRAANLSSTKIENFYPQNYHYDIVIRPNISSVKRWHIGKIDFLIQQGRQAALRSLNRIKKDLEI